MATDQSTTPPPELQFDRAVFDADTPAGLTCQLCESPIATTYFDVNGQPTCPTCRTQLAASMGVDHGLRGVLAAVLAGIGAAVAGALIYYGVLAITGYEIGLIAVVVGLMVGNAVKWGSGGRGGRGFQVMAVVLTYLAIVSTYVPFVISGIQQAQTESQTQTQTPSRTQADATAPRQASPAAPSPDNDEAAMTRGEIALALVMMAGVLLALPFLGGVENVIGWLIIGFALWEAWKVNRPVSLEIAGPFEVGPAPPLPPPAPVV